MVLLLNGYLPLFIQRHFDRFFRSNQATSVRTELDVGQYVKLHQKLLYLPIRREKQRQRVGDKLWSKKIMRLSHTFERGPLINF